METIEQYGDLAVFVKVADCAGFSPAARALGISTSQASRLVARLEERLGARLLNRTTRRVALTEAGRALHERAARALAELEEAQAGAREGDGELRGTLRVTMPVDFGVRYVMPLVSRFAARHPGVRFELGLDDRRVDLVAEGYDLALRAGVLTDSSLVARRLRSSHIYTVAAPAYLAARGTPRHPGDLVGHDVLLAGRDPSAFSVRFTSEGDDVTVRVVPRVLANNVEALLPPVLAGLGIARLPDAVCGDDLAAGRLVRVLPGWDTQAAVWAVYPPGRHHPERLRAFLEFLTEAFTSGERAGPRDPR